MFPLDASSCSETPVLFAKIWKKRPENDGIFTHHFHRAYLLGKESSVCCFLLSFQTKSHGMSAISEGMPDFISCFVLFQSKYKCFPHAPDLLLSFCAGIVRPPGCQIRGFARLRGRRSCCSHATEIQTAPGVANRSIVINRISFLCHRFSVVALLAEALPVRLIPEQLWIAAVRHDVVNHSGSGVSPLFHADNTQRMCLQICSARLLPPAVVTAPGR